jgi:hypothetical protein
MLTEEVKSLFKIVRTQLGAPIRPVQLTDDQLCDLMKVAVGDYAQIVQNFIMKSNWMQLYGNNTIINPTDVAYAISLRQMTYAQQMSYYFSREVGLQQRGPFELKKDYFAVERGKQVYVIPSGREINNVMWCTPSTTKASLYGNFGVDLGIGGGFSQIGNYGNFGMGMSGFFFGNMYDVALGAASLKYANSMLRGDLAYKVTAGPDGTHLVHLLSTPGSKNQMGITMDDANLNGFGWGNYVGCYVWYTYYDTANGTDDEIDECRKTQKGVVISPDQVPFDKMEYEYLNNNAQQYVRQFLTAEAMITLALIRGYASGVVQIPEATLTLDYSTLKEEGEKIKDKASEQLDKFLEQLLPWNMLKNQADMMDSTKKILDMTPLKFYFR